MKKTNRNFIIIAFAAIIALVLTGCIGLLGVTISAENNLSSVMAGGTLNLRASGQNLFWKVSSTNDGLGPVANGTFITQNGTLTVDANETSPVIYVIVTSSQSEQPAIRPIRIVTVTGIVITPVNQSVAVGRTQQYRAQVAGNNNPDSAVTWRVSANAAGTGSVTTGTSINSNGILTVSANETLRTLYIIATSVVDTSKSGNVSATVVVPTVTQVIVAPANQSMRAGNTLQFSASVMGTHDPVNTVTWRVSSNVTGTGAVTPGTSISANGLLTVANSESLTTLYVIATSTYDTTKSGNTAVNIIIPTVTNVTVSPANQTIPAGSVIQFIASVSGSNDPNTAVTWSVSSNAAGTGTVASGTRIDSNGVLTVAAGETARTLFVFATSVFNPARSGSVAVNITAAVSPPAQTPTPTPPTTPAPTTPTRPGGGGGRPNQTTPPTSQTPAPTPTPAPTTPTVAGVSVSPATRSTQTNRTVQFNAAVTGANNPSTAVTWRVSSNAAGTGEIAPRTTINSNGLLTVAPNEWNPTLYVFATSVADPTKTAMATVTVTNANQNQGPNQGS